jgi:hypothetical protein
MNYPFKSNLNLQYGNLLWTIYKVIKVEAVKENNQSVPAPTIVRGVLFISTSLFLIVFQLGIQSEDVKGQIIVRCLVSYVESLKGFQ